VCAATLIASHTCDGCALVPWLMEHLRGKRAQRTVTVCGVPVLANDVLELFALAGITYRVMRSNGYPLLLLGEIRGGGGKRRGVTISDGRAMIEMRSLRGPVRVGAPAAPVVRAGVVCALITAPGGEA
jgi:hypothetical protein